MSNATALQVMRTALQQYAYTESPAGSNNNKYGRAFGLNYVPWCAEYVWYCGEQPEGSNPIAKSANAAYIQDNTVSQKGGTYILKQTANNSKKKAALSKVRFGDSISFNFNGGSLRSHTALVVGRWKNYIRCIEGNTSFRSTGSQSNGGCVALRERYYTTGVCIVRPNYTAHKWHVPDSAYTGKTVKLPARGWFDYGDDNNKVVALQEALAWANGYKLTADGEFGPKTFAEVVIFQVAHGIEPDGEFGEKSLKKLDAMIEKYKVEEPTPEETVPDKTTPTESEPVQEEPVKKKTKGEKLNDRAIKECWAYGTKKKKYHYPTGAPKKAYKKDLNEMFPDRKSWRKQTRLGASCDVFAATAIRASGADKKFPRMLDKAIPYLKEHTGKWRKIKAKDGKYKPKQLKGGDVVVCLYKGGGGHICIVVEKNGKKYIAEAGYHSQRWPVLAKKLSTMNKDSYKMLRVYRAKN